MKRICIVTHSTYPADERAVRGAEALAEAGMSVDVICLRDAGEAARETIRGVQVYRLPLQRKRGGKLRYVADYILFIGFAFLKTIRASSASTLPRGHNS